MDFVAVDYPIGVQWRVPAYRDCYVVVVTDVVRVRDVGPQVPGYRRSGRWRVHVGTNLGRSTPVSNSSNRDMQLGVSCHGLLEFDGRFVRDYLQTNGKMVPSRCD